MLSTLFIVLLVLKVLGVVEYSWAYVLLPLGVELVIGLLQLLGIRLAFWRSYPQRMRRYDRMRHGKDWDGWP